MTGYPRGMKRLEQLLKEVESSHHTTVVILSEGEMARAFRAIQSDNVPRMSSEVVY